MKKLSIVCLGILVAIQVLAQDNGTAAAKQDSIPEEFGRQAFIYNMAKNYNDPAVARMALYNLLSYNPMNTTLLDSLALMYFDYNQMASAALIAQDAATINPDDMFAVEIAALSFERLGALPKAITFYESLYLQSQDISTLYKIGFMQKDVKRYIEASASADNVIEDPKSDEIKIIFPKGERQNQEVSLKASAYRLKGLIELEQKNTEKAKEYFQKALELAPEFEVLKKELADIEK